MFSAHKLRPKMHLHQPGFSCNACWTYTKNKEKIRKFKEAGGSRYIYRNELDKAWCENDLMDILKI